MVDLTRDQQGRVHARLLDLVPGRSKKAYADWLVERGAPFRDGIEIAALDPFGGYKSAIGAELADATAVLDVFHVVKLGTQVVDEVRRRVQQDTTGHRGRKGDPLFGIQTILRAGAENLTDRQLARLENAIEPTRPTTRSTSPGAAPKTSERPTGPSRPTRAAPARRRSWPRSTPARSPRSPAWDGPCVAGATRSWPTSTPTARTTAGPKRSTASSNCTGAWPAATATATTTGYACSWLPAG
ncbi:hypothetical protein FHR89_002738 [Cellulomonas uda]|nr:hypothetical protein [Cellulomonas uda]